MRSATASSSTAVTHQAMKANAAKSHRRCPGPRRSIDACAAEFSSVGVVSFMREGGQSLAVESKQGPPYRLNPLHAIGCGGVAQRRAWPPRWRAARASPARERGKKGDMLLFDK